MLGVQMAIKMYMDGLIKKIVITRPAVSVDEEHGFLPGTLNQKMEPWTRPIMDVFEEYYRPREIADMLTDGVIEIAPLAMMRGRTFKHSFIICDEMQNADIKQLMTTITRFGEGSKITIIGDSRQNDINEKYVALDFFVKEILGEDDQMFHFKFDRTDIVRDPLLIKIIDNYEKALAEGRIPNTKRKN